MMRFLSVCSGMEAASVAWEPLGWKAVGFSEIEPFPCAILKHRFPNTPNYGSLTEYQKWPVGPGTADVLVGGCPCQSFSVAGLRRGMQDPRGNLTLTYLGLADKVKPKWIVYENVPGLLSSNGGRDFGSFLGALVELGYGFAYRVLDAQHFGVPQRRRRVFVVACLGDWAAAAEVLSIGEGLRGYLEAGGKKRKAVAPDAGSGVEADGLQRTVGTLCADTHPGAYSGQDAYTGRLIPFEPPTPCHDENIVGTLCARDFKGVGNQYVQEGKCVPMMFKVRGGSPVETGEQGGTLGKSAGKGLLGSEEKAFTIATDPDQWLAQAIPIDDGRAIEKHQNGLGVGKPGDPAYTLDTLGAQSVAIPYRKSKRASSTTDNKTWVEADASNTLNNFDLGDTRTTHAVVGAVYENHAQDSRVNGPLDVAPTVAAKFGTEGGNVPLVGAMAVRRLTPVECERLQGFPDNWSQIPWKGKPADQCPDGPRYKACGNSMAVPVMRWIGEQIARVELSHNQPTNINA